MLSASTAANAGTDATATTAPSRAAPARPTPEATVDPAMVEQAEVARLVREGTRWQRFQVAARAGARLFRDPEDTQQVFLLGLLLNRNAIAPLVGRMATEEGGLQLLADKPSIDSAHVDYDYLRSLADGSLGREYVRFLDDNQLDPDMFQEPPGLPAVPGFVARRMRQSHDIWHVVTGYATDIPGEIALQAFTYGQLGAPSAAFVALVGCARWSAKHPLLASLAWRAYRRGQSVGYLPVVRWEDHWERPLADVRAELGLA